MADLIKSMLEYTDSELGTNDVQDIEKAIGENKELRKIYHLNNRLNESMKVHFMLQEIKSDASLPEIESAFNAEIAGKSEDSFTEIGLSAYINGALKVSSAIEKQMMDAEGEMILHAINTEISTWVETYMLEKNITSANDIYTNEIKSFIKNGLITSKTCDIGMPVKQKRKKIFYRIASIAAVLVISFGLWSVFYPKSTPDQLYSSYYKPYEIRSEITRGDSNSEENLNTIIALYQKGDFEKAALDLEILSKEKNSPAKVLMMFGITQLELKKYNIAEESFKMIIDSGHEFTIEAKWYLALCYLKTNKINESKKLLTELSETPGLYKPKAIDLLKDL